MRRRPHRQPVVPGSPHFLAVVALFVTCLITANIIAVKLIEIGPWEVPAGVILFPIASIIAFAGTSGTTGGVLRELIVTNG